MILDFSEFRKKVNITRWSPGGFPFNVDIKAEYEDLVFTAREKTTKILDMEIALINLYVMYLNKKINELTHEK